MGSYLVISPELEGFDKERLLICGVVVLIVWIKSGKFSDKIHERSGSAGVGLRLVSLFFENWSDRTGLGQEEWMENFMMKKYLKKETFFWVVLVSRIGGQTNGHYWGVWTWDCEIVTVSKEKEIFWDYWVKIVLWKWSLVLCWVELGLFY